MIIRNLACRRAARVVARCGFALSLAAFSVSLIGVFAATSSPASAAPTVGSAELISPTTEADGTPIADGGAPINEGDTATRFTVRLPAGAACTGDSANDDYRVFGYMIGSSIDLATMEFVGNTGPVPEKNGSPITEFRQPLWDETGSPYQAAQTANADDPPGPGLIINIPTFSFEPYFSAEYLPAGEYNAGIACVDASGALDKYWNLKLTFTESASDTGPVGLIWTAEQTAAGEDTDVELTADPSSSAEAGETVTLTAVVTPDDAEGTVTFEDGTQTLDEVDVADGEAVLEVDDLEVGDHTLTATFTPDDEALEEATSEELEYSITEAGGATDTTTTTASTTTSTTIPGTGSDGGTASGSASSSSGGPVSATPLGDLAFTGSSWWFAVWGVLLVVFGRMVILFGREPTVIPSRVG